MVEFAVVVKVKLEDENFASFRNGSLEFFNRDCEEYIVDCIGNIGTGDNESFEVDSIHKPGLIDIITSNLTAITEFLSDVAPDREEGYVNEPNINIPVQNLGIDIRNYEEEVQYFDDNGSVIENVTNYIHWQAEALVFKCLNCGIHNSNMSIQELCEVGNPVCSVCGVPMHLVWITHEPSLLR